MIPRKILSLFELIDYLDENRIEYIEKYIPLCDEIENLRKQSSKLKPNNNYADKQKYDIIQNEINEKFSLVLINVCTPISEKLKELCIWSGDEVCSSIWNNNYSTISNFKANFSPEDISPVMIYKKKYLIFRIETNTNFLCLQLIFSELDELLKVLFEFFSDTDDNEFAKFEVKTISVDSIGEVIRSYLEDKSNNVKFSIPIRNLNSKKEEILAQKYLSNIKNEIYMGDRIEVGSITNASGNIIIGKEIRLSDSLNGKKESAEKIEELINFIRREANIDDDQKQSLITNFDKVKEEILEDVPDKSKIFKWLSKTKTILENLVLTHDVVETVHWIYENLNFRY